MRIVLFALLAVTALLTGGRGSRADALGPSFDCAKAIRPAEVVICSDDELKLLDWWLAAVYRDALAVSPDRAADLQDQQRRWLVERDHVCDLASVTLPVKRDEKLIACVTRRYFDRTAALVRKSIEPIWQNAGADPARALAALEPLHSPLAVTYADLLTHALANESMKAFSDFSGAIAERVADTPVWKYGPGIHIHMPCTLIERHPRLLLVARSYFGSSMDLSLPEIDCSDGDYQAYPKPVARFLRFEPGSYQNMFDRCAFQGTIFHAYARDLRLLQLRMARFPASYLSAELSQTFSPETPWPATDTIETADWSAPKAYQHARNSLAAYYRTRFRLSTKDATLAASRALWDSRYEGENPTGC